MAVATLTLAKSFAVIISRVVVTAVLLIVAFTGVRCSVFIVPVAGILLIVIVGRRFALPVFVIYVVGVPFAARRPFIRLFRCAGTIIRRQNILHLVRVAMVLGTVALIVRRTSVLYGWCLFCSRIRRCTS